MSATSAVRAFARDIAGEAVRMVQASTTPLTVSALERAYAPLRPTIYRPSRPSRVVSDQERPRSETVLTIQRR